MVITGLRYYLGILRNRIYAREIHITFNINGFRGISACECHRERSYPAKLSQSSTQPAAAVYALWIWSKCNLVYAASRYGYDHRSGTLHRPFYDWNCVHLCPAGGQLHGFLDACLCRHHAPARLCPKTTFYRRLFERIEFRGERIDGRLNSERDIDIHYASLDLCGGGTVHHVFGDRSRQHRSAGAMGAEPEPRPDSQRSLYRSGFGRQ